MTISAHVSVVLFIYEFVITCITIFWPMQLCQFIENKLYEFVRIVELRAT